MHQKCMGLLLLKDRDGRSRRTWYAIVNVNGKRTSRVLKTPLRGKIPLDENAAILALSSKPMLPTD